MGIVIGWVSDVSRLSDPQLMNTDTNDKRKQHYSPISKNEFFKKYFHIVEL